MLDDAQISPLSDEEKARRLPEPQGFNMLCALPKISATFDSGLIKADVTQTHEALLTTVLFVLKQGADCYKDTRRFPTGPWCKEGDFVVVMPHAGGRIKIDGQELRIIKDESVLATVDDPRGVTRA